MSHRVAVLALDAVLPMEVGMPFQTLGAVPGAVYDVTLCGERAGNDLALHSQAFDPGIDQSGAELRQEQDADQQGRQARDVEKDDTAGEAGKALAEEE